MKKLLNTNILWGIYFVHLFLLTAGAFAAIQSCEYFYLPLYAGSIILLALVVLLMIDINKNCKQFKFLWIVMVLILAPVTSALYILQRGDDDFELSEN